MSHYCRICGRHRPNEKFSGKGHVTHVCKDCMQRKKKMKNTKEPDPEVVRDAILEIVQNQLRDNNPPETRQTLDRLIAEGVEEEEAIKMIACCVSTEIFHVLKYQENSDEERYIKNLKRLPQLPWE
jgi:predicted  nucleic acid-binding Zn-ribbon protein